MIKTATGRRLGLAAMSSPAVQNVATVLCGIAILTASSRIQVPWYPVPMTLQTLAVPLLGAVFGWRIGLRTVLSWLVLAAVGLPVLAGQVGIAAFSGPTAGYLAAFPVAVVLSGILADRGWNGSRPLLAFAAMLLANAICLCGGYFWLAALIGGERAFTVGVLPFVTGAIVKSGLAACALTILARRLPGKPAV